MNLLNTFKQLLSEGILAEARTDFSQLHGGEALFVIENGDHTKLLLVDMLQLDIDVDQKFKPSAYALNEFWEEFQDAILGYLYLTNVDEDIYHIDSIAAKKGYGLMMYELAMQQVYPLGIASDRFGFTNDGAFRLHSYFFHGNSPDVNIERFDKNSSFYIDCLDSEEANVKLQCGQTDEDTIALYNSYLRMEPNEITQLKARGDAYRTRFVNLKDKFIEQAGYSFFSRKY